MLTLIWASWNTAYLVGEKGILLEVETEFEPSIVRIKRDSDIGQILQHRLVVLLHQPHQRLLVPILEHVKPELGDSLGIGREVWVQTEVFNLLGKNHLKQMILSIKLAV